MSHWLPPEGATGTLEAFDPRPGGAFRLTLHFSSGQGGKTTRDTDTVSGRFVDLEPNETVVQEFDFVSDDPAFAGTMRMTWGLAWCVVQEPQGASGALSSGSFGHGGAFGTQAWIDPQKKLAYVLMVQRANYPNADASDLRREFQDAAAAALAR